MDIVSAIRKNDTSVLASYIKIKGNVNVRDHNDMTLLLLAVDNGNIANAKLLIAAGADLDLKDKWGQTALMLAAGRGNTEIVELLISAKADAHAKAKNGLTAFGYASENGRVNIIKLFEKEGIKK